MDATGTNFSNHERVQQMPILTQAELDARRRAEAAATRARLDAPISLPAARDVLVAVLQSYGEDVAPVEAIEAGPGDERDELIITLRRNEYGFRCGRPQKFRVTLAPIV